jgi:hypothetical protein
MAKSALAIMAAKRKQKHENQNSVKTMAKSIEIMA